MMAGNSSYIKQLNRQSVLTLIRKRGGVTRPIIARESGLTTSAVAEITKSLLQEGLILEGDTLESTGGRPSKNLLINKSARYAIGCDFDNNQVTTVMLDFTGQVVRQERRDYEITSPESIMEGICDGITKIIDACHLERRQILGIGISVPGLVNSRTGDVYFLTHYNMENVALHEYIQKRTGLPVYVLNDANAAALAEYSTGAGQQCKNMICVICRRGIGAGIILEGKLFQGTNGVAGEIGHQTVDINGPRCNCGNYGCLEMMSGTNAIVARVKTKLKQRNGSSYFHNVEDFDRITLDDLVLAARAGDTTVLSVFEEAGIYLGIGISSVINFFNPDCVILSGDLKKYYPYVKESLLQTVTQKTMRFSARHCRIRTSEYGDNVTAIGAGEVILTDYFNGGNLINQH